MPYLALILCLITAGAIAQQDPAPVQNAVETWLRAQTRDLPGEASFEITPIGANNRLIPCRNFDISRPGGGPVLGRMNILVHCTDRPGWRTYLPALVRLRTEYLIAIRPIAQGQLLTAEDIALQSGDLAELPARTLTDSQLAIGKMASAPIAAGKPLRADLLKAALVIRQGQTVRVISRGAGFEVTNEGRALNNVAEGQLAQIRLANGQILSGTAKASGIVEVSH